VPLRAHTSDKGGRGAGAGVGGWAAGGAEVGRAQG
jgi:hypothetical protein